MKKTLLTMALVATTASVFAQGAIQYGNNFTGVFRAPIYGVQDTAVSGQSSLGVPAGTTVYTAPLLQGTGWTVGFYAGATADTMSLLATSTFRTSANAGAVPAGLFATQATVTVPGVEAGSTGVFQFRVWDTASGSYANAAFRGASAITPTIALGGTSPTGPVSTPSTIGWASFNLVAVPEPTSFALAGLGAAALLIFRRRN